MSEIIDKLLSGANCGSIMATLEKSGDKKALECLQGMKKEIESTPELFKQMCDKVKAKVIKEVTPAIKKELMAKWKGW